MKILKGRIRDVMFWQGKCWGDGKGYGCGYGRGSGRGSIFGSYPEFIQYYQGDL